MWTRILNACFTVFFVLRIIIALLATATGFYTWIHIGGPNAWLAWLMVWVYMPVCVAFVLYNVALLVERMWKERASRLNWWLFFAALVAELLYLRYGLWRL